MKDTDFNRTRLKSLIDRLGDNWSPDSTDPSAYEGTEHLVVFAYNMAGDWTEFYELLREAQKEVNTLIEMELLTTTPDRLG